MCAFQERVCSEGRTCIFIHWIQKLLAEHVERLPSAMANLDWVLKPFEGRW